VKFVSFFTFETVSRGGRKRGDQLDSKLLLVGVNAFLFSVFQLVLGFYSPCLKMMLEMVPFGCTPHSDWLVLTDSADRNIGVLLLARYLSDCLHGFSDVPNEWQPSSSDNV